MDWVKSRWGRDCLVEKTADNGRNTMSSLYHYDLTIVPLGQTARRLQWEKNIARPGLLFFWYWGPHQLPRCRASCLEQVLRCGGGTKRCGDRSGFSIALLGAKEIRL